MNNIRAIERKWVENFKRSPLVVKETQSYSSIVAHQLFYGKTNENYPSEYPSGFKQFYENSGSLSREDVIETIFDFLHFIGIRFKRQILDAHLEKFPGDFTKLKNKCYYIIKTLAHFDERLNINTPFYDNSGDIYFFLRIASEQSIHGGQLNLYEDIELPDLYKKSFTIPDGYSNDPSVLDLFSQIEGTNDSFFVTGKAGTGKSTFIHFFTQTTKKKVLLLAFTGIAAINIGGQTIHSFFKFPLRPLLPEDEGIPIFKQYSNNFQLIRELDVLIIDEVSMLRSDILQAIDFSIRHNGGNPNLPFGGKQILFFGDVFQLPPVLENDSDAIRVIFKEVYESEYFFSAPAYKKLSPKYFEFKISHRQSSEEFIELLDSVRLCKADEETIKKINGRYIPNFVPPMEQFTIHLTSNNNIANLTNGQKLQSINAINHSFEASIVGEYSEDKFPTSRFLNLKKMAQIILLKNDFGGRWVNGTIAKIDFIANEFIEIRLQDGSVCKLEKSTWENRRYKYDRDKRKIVSEVVGTFTQYPVKLAWAITIHKSQGLTFDNVNVDLGTGAFANGQVYTALSRCRHISGLTLSTKLKQEDIISDPRVLQFYYSLTSSHQ